MKKISIPLQMEDDGRVVYQGVLENWREATIQGDKLVGYYVGPLYKSNGITKLFAWTEEPSA